MIFYIYFLILPKEHFKDVCELDEAVAAKVLPLGAKIGAAMKEALGCAGFNLVQNNGVAAGQTVFHFHLHVLPRFKDDTLNFLQPTMKVDSQYLEDLQDKILK